MPHTIDLTAPVIPQLERATISAYRWGFVHGVFASGSFLFAIYVMCT